MAIKCAVEKCSILEPAPPSGKSFYLCAEHRVLVPLFKELLAEDNLPEKNHVAGLIWKIIDSVSDTKEMIPSIILTLHKLDDAVHSIEREAIGVGIAITEKRGK